MCGRYDQLVVPNSVQCEGLQIQIVIMFSGMLWIIAGERLIGLVFEFACWSCTFWDLDGIFFAYILELFFGCPFGIIGDCFFPIRLLRSCHNLTLNLCHCEGQDL